MVPRTVVICTFPGTRRRESGFAERQLFLPRTFGYPDFAFRAAGASLVDVTCRIATPSRCAFDDQAQSGPLDLGLDVVVFGQFSEMFHIE